MSWAIEHVADFTPDWYTQVHLGVLDNGTTCICWMQSGDVYEATRALGATEWSIGVILSSAQILANDPGGMSYFHYAARGSTRAFVYGTYHTTDVWYPDLNDPTQPWYSIGAPPQLWLGTNASGGWSFNTLCTYTEFMGSPYAYGYDYYDSKSINGVGCAIASDGSVGVLVTQNGSLLGDTPDYLQTEFWHNGLTIIETIECPPGRGAGAVSRYGDNVVVDSNDVFYVLWDDTDPTQEAWPYEVKYAQVGGALSIVYSDEYNDANGVGLVLDATDNVFVFYSVETYDEGLGDYVYTGYCASGMGGAETTAAYDYVSGTVKGAGLNAAASLSGVSFLQHLTRTASGTWRVADIVSRTVYGSEMSSYNSKLYVAFMDDTGVWLARQATTYSYFQAF
jgi:hypothetical protein